MWPLLEAFELGLLAVVSHFSAEEAGEALLVFQLGELAFEEVSRFERISGNLSSHKNNLLLGEVHLVLFLTLGLLRKYLFDLDISLGHGMIEDGIWQLVVHKARPQTSLHLIYF